MTNLLVYFDNIKTVLNIIIKGGCGLVCGLKPLKNVHTELTTYTQIAVSTQSVYIKVVHGEGDTLTLVHRK